MLVVAFALSSGVPVGWCFALIVPSAGLNLYLSFRYPDPPASPLSAIRHPLLRRPSTRGLL